MTEENILELGRHTPSVDSVISRLDRYKDQIKSIVAIVQWEDGSSDVYHEECNARNLTYCYFMLQLYISQNSFEPLNGEYDNKY